MAPETRSRALGQLEAKGLMRIVEEAVARSGKSIAIRIAVVGLDGRLA